MALNIVFVVDVNYTPMTVTFPSNQSINETLHGVDELGGHLEAGVFFIEGVDDVSQQHRRRGHGSFRLAEDGPIQRLDPFAQVRRQEGEFVRLRGRERGRDVLKRV